MLSSLNAEADKTAQAKQYLTTDRQSTILILSIGISNYFIRSEHCYFLDKDTYDSEIWRWRCTLR